jgi:hypothetical protein
LGITRAPKRAQIAQLVEQRIENPRGHPKLLAKNPKNINKISRLRIAQFFLRASHSHRTVLRVLLHGRGSFTVLDTVFLIGLVHIVGGLQFTCEGLRGGA